MVFEDKVTVSVMDGGVHVRLEHVPDPYRYDFAHISIEDAKVLLSELGRVISEIEGS